MCGSGKSHFDRCISKTSSLAPTLALDPRRHIFSPRLSSLCRFGCRMQQAGSFQPMASDARETNGPANTFTPRATRAHEVRSNTKSYLNLIFEFCRCSKGGALKAAVSAVPGWAGWCWLAGVKDVVRVMWCKGNSLVSFVAILSSNENWIFNKL